MKTSRRERTPGLRRHAKHGKWKVTLKHLGFILMKTTNQSRQKKKIYQKRYLKSERGQRQDTQDTQAPRRGRQCAPKPHTAPESTVLASPHGSLPQNTPIGTLTYPERSVCNPLGNPCPEHVGNYLKEQVSDIKEVGDCRSQTPIKTPLTGRNCITAAPPAM